MDGDKIRCSRHKCKNTKFGTPEVIYHLCMWGFIAEYYNWTSHGENIVQNYYEAPSVPQVSEEPTLAGHVEGVPDNGTRSCPVDAGTSSNIYDGGYPYDYDESGLADHFFNIVHAANQSFGNDCNQSQLGVVAELVDIKTDGHIFEQIYDRISQWANRILPSDHTLPGDYYNTKKLVKGLGLPIEKIHTCKNDCMLYWKDNINLEYYYKFCGDGRYKPARGRDPHRKKSYMQSLGTYR
ncbi:UNVERIFIED_CONTAM: hypothetical protein Sangu_2245500 [Sesamum angustifolium]|uniref:Transposase-associated domain-containing protein n=1 Tax=Sesamum angustifolium TaxID=2727405 RepID=A0AAW2L3Z2_9LAMI